jgi:heterodisulfide reductase subunit A
MRTYGFKEDYYQKAREKGIIFIRYTPDRKPKVKQDDDRLTVKIFDELLNENLVIDTDILTLSVGIIPYEENHRMSQLLKVPLNEDGFFLASRFCN